jgi:small subunit ribosomal protein S1
MATKQPVTSKKKPAVNDKTKKSTKKEEAPKKERKAKEVVEVTKVKKSSKEVAPSLDKVRENKDTARPVYNTMEELLAAANYTLKAPKPGDVVKGLVTDVSKRMVLIDIGAKTEGMVVDKEYEAAKDLVKDLTVGDEVSAYVVSPENDRGQILLSLKRAMIDRRWEQFAEFMQTGDTVEVKGLEVNKGGMIVVADGLRGFVPSSQFGKQFLGQMEQLLNKAFTVKVIEVNKEKNRLIFSERHVSEAEAIAKKSEALKHVKANDMYDGVVSGIMPFGVFVGVEVPLTKPQATSNKKQAAMDVGKIEGLVHISEIAWEKVNDPNDYFKLGDKVRVRVLGVDENVGKLNLSVKQLTDDPWTHVEEKYPIGAKVNGRVTRIAPFGVFVTLEPGVDGLIHISKVPAGEEPKVGESIEIFVESVNMEQRRMSLGMVLTEVPVGYK